MSSSQSDFGPNAADDDLSVGRGVLWASVLFALGWPRLCLLGFWIFSDLLDDAFDGWVVPAIGFFVLPWTTGAYATMWSVSSNEVSGAEWVVVAIAVILDLATWAGVRRLR